MIEWKPQVPDVDSHPNLYRVIELYVDGNRTGELYSIVLPEGECWYWTRYLGRADVPAPNKEIAMQQLVNDAGVYFDA